MTELIKLFEAYDYILNKRFDDAKKIIDDNLNKMINMSAPYKSIWLWVFFEYIEQSADKSFLEKNRNQGLIFISNIMNAWKSPTANIWGHDPNLVHISNLGIYYSSLSAAKRILGMTEIQQVLTEIRDFVFDHGLSKGMLIQSPAKKEVSSDLLLTVMPFGLYSPEDLVIVEAVNEIEQHLTVDGSVFLYRGLSEASSVSTAWLAWYYTEKGDMKKARFYLKNSEQIIQDTDRDENELALILIRIVRFFIDEITKSNGEMEIIHIPYGNDNLYDVLKVEREPRDPEVNQEVKVHAQIWPEQENIKVYVRVETNKRKFEVPCLPIYSDDEKIWEASIGSFSFDEEVNYYFSIQKDNKEVKKGSTYTFYPLSINYLKSVESIEIIGNTIWLKGNDYLDINPIYLGISKINDEIQLNVSYEYLPRMEAKNEHSISSQINVSDNNERITITIDSWVCMIEKDPFQLKILHANNLLLQGYRKVFPVLRWWMNKKKEILNAEWNFETPLDERFFGFGERYNRIEQRGESLDCYVYNQYRDQGTRTYMPVPFFISSKDYGLYLDSAYYSEFHLGSEFQDLLSIKTNLKNKSFSFKLFSGKPKEILQQYIDVTGKPVLPPKWAFGPWMSSNNWDRDSIVRKQVELTNHYKIPATVLVIEQWSDEATYYIFNDAEYQIKSGQDYLEYNDFHFPKWGRWPNPKGLFEDLHENGLKVILWQIPIHKYLNKQHHQQKDEDENYMLKAGYAVKQADGVPFRIPEGWFKESLLIDFSNLEGTKWWFNKRKYLLDIGVDGFKTDGGEFIFGRDLKFADGKTGAEMRNLYPNAYIKAYYDFVTDYHHGDAMTFSRAGFTGAQNYPAHWAGDERSTFDAFRHSLIAGLTSGLSGIPFWGWDLAGFNGDIPTAELFIRSAQMAAFCPIMQYHAESKGEFNQDRTPWNIADRTNDIRALEGYRQYANTRMNLLPYIYDQARKTSDTGIPMMRSLFMEYPNDKACYHIYDQYLFGENLMIAPVIEEGALERKVYFPEGTWIDMWSNDIIIGSSLKSVKAALMEIPVYVKEGSAILCNCDETLSLGSWVGNAVDHYNTPVIRLYPADGMDEKMIDHLNNIWTIKVKYKKSYWHIDVVGYHYSMMMIPTSLLTEGEGIIVNNKKHQYPSLKVKDGFYLVDLRF